MKRVSVETGLGRDEWNQINVSAKSYNDTCTEDDQCKPLLGEKATCNDNQCTCDETLHFKDGKCNDKKGDFFKKYLIATLKFIDDAIFWP